MNFLKLVLLLCAIFSLFNLKQVAYGESLTMKDRDPVEMQKMPAGEFFMGSKQEEGRSDEQPQRKIYLDAYEIDSQEVSNKRYLKFIHETKRKEPPNPYSGGLISKEKGISGLPVVQVTWYDAVDYCRWAGKRLPSEAQWEKAARGNKGYIFPWGSELSTLKSVNFQKNWKGIQTLWPVSVNAETSSPYGLRGMAGNVREWVQDWYAPDYFEIAPSTNPQGPKEGVLKVIKGGSWHSFKADIRSASRGKGGFALKTDGIGFRCASKIKLKH
jgi:formylglycine-generating enzyme